MADLSDGTNWFETDASNNKGPPNGWPEGMMPSGVNDTARADKGALKRFWDRINPIKPIVPSGGVWTFVTDNAAYPTAYADGEVYTFGANGDASGGDRFQVNSLGTKPIWKRTFGGWTPIVAGDIKSAQPPMLIYDSGLNGGSGAFILVNPFVPISGNGSGGLTVNGPISAQNYLINGTGYDIYDAAGTLNFQVGPTGGPYSYFSMRSSGEFDAANAVVASGAGTALYAPNGNVVCQNVLAAGTGFDTSMVAIHASSGAIQSDHYGTAFYAPNGDLVCQNVTASVQGFKPGGGSWAAISDVRLKQDIRDYETGLAAILALRPVTYAFNGKGRTARDGKRYVGLVADEVLPVMPEMVGTMSALLDPDDAAPSEIKTLDTTALIFALVNCCQELAARVATLEANVRD